MCLCAAMWMFLGMGWLSSLWRLVSVVLCALCVPAQVQYNLGGETPRYGFEVQVRQEKENPARCRRFPAFDSLRTPPESPADSPPLFFCCAVRGGWVRSGWTISRR